jgi:hypothetical protein
LPVPWQPSIAQTRNAAGHATASRSEAAVRTLKLEAMHP